MFFYRDKSFSFISVSGNKEDAYAATNLKPKAKPDVLAGNGYCAFIYYARQ